MTDTANEDLEKSHHKSNPWVSNEILDLYDCRRSLKKNKHTTQRREAHAEIKKQIRREMRKAKQNWIEKQCEDIEDCLSSNNTKNAFKLVKDLTKKKTGHSQYHPGQKWKKSN